MRCHMSFTACLFKSVWERAPHIPERPQGSRTGASLVPTIHGESACQARVVGDHREGARVGARAGQAPPLQYTSLARAVMLSPCATFRVNSGKHLRIHRARPFVALRVTLVGKVR